MHSSRLLELDAEITQRRPVLPRCGRLPSSPEVAACEDVDERTTGTIMKTPQATFLAAAEITPAGEVDPGEHDGARRVRLAAAGREPPPSM